MASPQKGRGIEVSISPEILSMMMSQGSTGSVHTEPGYGKEMFTPDGRERTQSSSGSGKPGYDFAPSGGSGVGSWGSEQSRGSSPETLGGATTPRKTLIGG
jgi:hypothetical protein